MTGDWTPNPDDVVIDPGPDQIVFSSGEAGAEMLRRMFPRGAEPTEVHLLGRQVNCDVGARCNLDWTDRPESGGFLFGSATAVCPDCAPGFEAGARSYGEAHLITARCPEGTSFADWVRDLRGPDASVRIYREPMA